ncbi:CHAD domain-containing protein [Cylindrospermopsis raciborskii]|uniref:Metal-binding protein n=1 Tax=Cylindrospermopsis raciborskii CENA302 TaxID=1170768 RepID=A0A9Q5QVL3_9CYAN|nr:CHAD domain-containing protein [Cylindrospermopsis raciborskii]MCZ2201892.1 CHAD domain-containing protein [Cylindrospermopsis raciborskii PAMP2012]MCZ2204505.1 CHAD domain-containing protein [Cylindrospermopsis raciborskii PAMP2011]NLQ04097.1 CHAD domain-containing protein [Cylindrospermopsis raciborskii MVCC19]OHY31722.1 metal-binding protein [Cylindrospermopsis raciborskii MVCC14]OPH09213.1 metal-binding protein [Cylindrospermopsis raciborskii CENA302]
MKLITTSVIKLSATSLGNLGHQALTKIADKTLNFEKSVKKYQDPTALHQMRVGMRRLRTAVASFSSFLDLPSSVNDQNIGKIARTLGKLRDLDVLKEILERDYEPYLSSRQQSSLQRAFSAISQERESVCLSVQKIFKSELYKSFKQDLLEWLKNPMYNPLAQLQIQQAVPELLLPQISRFLLHPGWIIGMETLDPGGITSIKWTPEELEKNLQIQGEILHDLRKNAKRVRYQIDLFDDLYQQSFTQQLGQIKQVQEILGNLQDSMVLNKWLLDIFKSEGESSLTEIMTLLSTNCYQLWQQWQTLQMEFLKTETRKNLYLTVLHLE